jgi:DNA invertase Pin-like site-specific DNA recombinase
MTFEPGVHPRVFVGAVVIDPTMQTSELREYISRRGWTVAGEYVDIGISGTKEKRPELDRLMQDAHRRRFDAVVVWKFDRFARSVSHLLRALETFKAQGIEFVSFSEQMDTSTPAGKMVFTVLGAVAELERSLIVERVRAGMRNARSKGKRTKALRIDGWSLLGVLSTSRRLSCSRWSRTGDLPSTRILGSVEHP